MVRFVLGHSTFLIVLVIAEGFQERHKPFIRLRRESTIKHLESESEKFIRTYSAYSPPPQPYAHKDASFRGSRSDIWRENHHHDDSDEKMDKLLEVLAHSLFVLPLFMFLLPFAIPALPLALVVDRIYEEHHENIAHPMNISTSSPALSSGHVRN